MTYKFTTVITQEGKWFIARCIELGVVSQGESIAKLFELQSGFEENNKNY